MINQEIFIEKYKIDKVQFDNTQLKWEDLELIYNDFYIFKKELEQTAIYLFNNLMLSKKVHSIRYRIKNEEHLIEKIIRKKIEDVNSNITLENYKEVITDLIGLRALHLFKEEWITINDYICEKFKVLDKPIANYRKGDSEEIIKYYAENGCITKEHKYGYRSVHYIIETQPSRIKIYAEIQVRTIYEEAWAEIDHKIRYPYDLDNNLYYQFLLILNRLSGSADEMGSYIILLKKELDQREINYQKNIDEKDNLIETLEKKIAKLGLDENEFKSLKDDLNNLKLKEMRAFSKLPNNFEHIFHSNELFHSIQQTRMAMDNLESSRSFLDSFNNSKMNTEKFSKIDELSKKININRI